MRTGDVFPFGKKSQVGAVSLSLAQTNGGPVGKKQKQKIKGIIVVYKQGEKIKSHKLLATSVSWRALN